MKTKKERYSPKMEHFFQIIGGDADVDHTQTIGRGYSQIIWGICPPPGFGTPVLNRLRAF